MGGSGGLAISQTGRSFIHVSCWNRSITQQTFSILSVHQIWLENRYNFNTNLNFWIRWKYTWPIYFLQFWFYTYTEPAFSFWLITSVQLFQPLPWKVNLYMTLSQKGLIVNIHISYPTFWSCNTKLIEQMIQDTCG